MEVAPKSKLSVKLASFCYKIVGSIFLLNLGEQVFQKKIKAVKEKKTKCFNVIISLSKVETGLTLRSEQLLHVVLTVRSYH